MHLCHCSLLVVDGNLIYKPNIILLDSTKINFVGEDVHVACGLLKLYFRELSEPIFLDRLYSEFVAAGRMQVCMYVNLDIHSNLH